MSDQKSLSLKFQIGQNDHALLAKSPAVQSFMDRYPEISERIETLEPKFREVLFMAVVIGQEEILIANSTPDYLRNLAEKLYEMNEFYYSLGGIFGYQSSIKELIAEKSDSQVYDIEPPKKFDLHIESEELDHYIVEGLRGLPELCEIWPCGGAADRLGLKDPKTKREYPAACFNFGGWTLLERLVRDLEAREYLYYKCFGVRIQTPIVVMTSLEKNNYQEIKGICEENHWFGRSPQLVRIVIQPSVPTFDLKGNWICDENGEVIFRPGGHGVLWRLLDKTHTFDFFKMRGVTKGVVRQINNPVAGLDSGILALIGYGLVHQKKFGFTSCPRVVQMHEGVNVVKVFKDHYQKERRAISNIEYCDFSALEKIDCKKSFPANANTLFVDLDTVQAAQRKHPFPGLILNFKTKKDNRSSARLESTMQNISDSIQMMEENSVFVTFNKREKTLAAIKRQKQENDDDIRETPESAFYALMKEAYGLLKSCKVTLPKWDHKTPPIYFSYHPALGPLYPIIRQKIRGGQITRGSTLNLEIAEVSLDNLRLDGSLHIETPYVMVESSSCSFRNVQVQGEVNISLGKNAHLIAEDIGIFEAFHIKVPDDTLMIASGLHGRLEWHSQPLLSKEPPFWNYVLNQDKIELKQKSGVTLELHRLIK